MTHPDHPPDYAERATTHDRLAASTTDEAARKMHRAMAAEFRRRARLTPGELAPPAAADPHLRFSAAAA